MKEKHAKNRCALFVCVLYNEAGGRIADCTNGGVTSKHGRVILVPEGAEVPGQNCGYPVLVVVRRNICGRDYLYAQPLSAPIGGNVGWMNGGNFVYSGDGRFREWVGDYPIPVHDRQETPAQYANSQD